MLTVSFLTCTREMPSNLFVQLFVLLFFFTYLVTLLRCGLCTLYSHAAYTKVSLIVRKIWYIEISSNKRPNFLSFQSLQSLCSPLQDYFSTPNAR